MKELRVVFMGTPDFSVPVLQELIKNTNVVLVVSQPDKCVGRKQILTKTPVKLEAEKNAIPIFQPTKIKEDYKPILDAKPDIIITCAYGQIIPASLLDAPKYGCINVHASLLPKYRGGAPIHHALLNGDEKTGITIMYMDEAMDSGDIIEQREYEIKPSDNVGTLHDQLSVLGANLLIDTLPSIVNGTNNRRKQDKNLVTYAYNIKREEERIDFQKKGEQILNQIRGLNPWPLANFLLNDTEIKVLSAHFEKESVEEVGKVVESKTTLGITCQDGVVYLEKIKPFGKKEMQIQDYLNGVDKEALKMAKVG